jgi:osmotically-inducible protein OsmY
MGIYVGRLIIDHKFTDAHLQERVIESLMQQFGLDFSGVEVSVEMGQVSLRGVVESSSGKLVVEYLVSCLPGVKDVHNLLEVKGKA